MTILELKDTLTSLKERANTIIDKAKLEVREMNEEENTEVNEILAKIEEIKTQIAELEKMEQERFKKLDDENQSQTEATNKSIDNVRMKKNNFLTELRNAIDNNKKSVMVNAETRAVQVTGQSGVHDSVVETEIEGILEPLYANSVLTQLGARWYSGLPHGDVQIPVMGKQTVKWEGEVDDADATAPTFTTVKLSPKRLSAYVDISKQLIYQDTVGVEAAIRRDIVNALNDKLEATVFGSAQATTEQPAGLFYNVTPTVINSYADLCNFEAGVEENNVYGEMKYVLSPKAKAALRSMIKGTNNSSMVYEAGEVEGVPTYVTSNIAANKLMFGNFENLIIGSWGDIEVLVDPYTQATKGCVRLVINAYFDVKPARSVAFAFGDTTVTEEDGEGGEG